MDIKSINEYIENNNWLTILEFNRTKLTTIYSAMVSEDNNLLDKYNHEFDWCVNNPFLDEKKLNEIGKVSNFEPIIYTQWNKDELKKYISIELILLYNLNFKDGVYSYYNEDEEINVEVIKIKEDKVQIKKSFLIKYLTAKQKNLIINFCFEQRSMNETKKISKIHKGTDIIYSENKQNLLMESEFKSIEKIIGKKCIKKKEYSAENTEIEKNEYEDYIVEGDEDEKEYANCKIEESADFFKKVFFEKKLLEKYYNNPDTYTVRDDLLSKEGFWDLPIDNNNSDYVVIFLGDLAKLTNKEQKYFKNYNIIPKNKKMSNTSIRRNFYGEFTDPECLDFIFKEKFMSLNDKWKEKNGDFLFLPLKKEDMHYFKTIRSLLTNEQNELDNCIAALAKVTNDSLNINNLKILLPDSPNIKEGKSVNLFCEILNKIGIKEEDYKIINELQAMRSSSSAHRKGTTFEKNVIKYNIDLNDKKNYFDRLLNKMSILFKKIEEKI